jgi:hypothetical protein
MIARCAETALLIGLSGATAAGLGLVVYVAYRFGTFGPVEPLLPLVQGWLRKVVG